jgi:hypothetical protein
MPSSLTRVAVEPDGVFEPGDTEFLARVIRAAERYPHPHSVFGGPKAAAYVTELANRSPETGEGWYGVEREHGLAAVHLSVYGFGDGRGHTLFKLRHPLFSGAEGSDCLTDAIEAAAAAAARFRPGTQKLVVFLGEKERNAFEAVRRAGFHLEGVLADYYRLGERCFVLGRTVRSA